MATLIYENRQGKREIQETDVEFYYETLALYLCKGEEGEDNYWEESFDGMIWEVDNEHLEFVPFNHSVTADIITIIIVFSHLNIENYIKGEKI